ncbi:MAG: V-type ATPase subunit [Christensenellaceae bacterium]|jgi:vacuolar-type H+-ATPase subunit C/Vma6|nr:V-type ATPase subunit [Christensenellaceae bacterium]
MKDGLLFANAVAKSKENGLFKSERLMRMIESENLEVAVKILAEANYGNGVIIDSPADFDKILDAELSLLPDFLKSVSVVGTGIECFFLSADYFNIKALLKSKFLSSPMNYAPQIGGLIPFETLKDNLLRDNFTVNPYIANAIREIENHFEIGLSPRFLDITLDKAMHQEINDRLKRRGIDPSIKKYFIIKADFINISSFVRSSKASASINFFSEGFITGGVLDLTFFERLYPDIDVLAEALNSTKYQAFSDFIKNMDLAGFDRSRDNYLLSIFKENQHDMFSVAPVVGYYLAKLTEITMLRMVLVCIKNNVDRCEIQKRLRSLYA